MNKKILLILTILLFSGCTNQKQYISKIMNLNLDNCRVEAYKDNHSGFLGDGQYFAKVKCSSTPEKVLDWNKMPLSKEIQKATDLAFCTGNGCHTMYELYDIPKIKDGYYYFYDRQNKTEDDSDLNIRSSYNFSLGIYDINNNTLYIYELDT